MKTKSRTLRIALLTLSLALAAVVGVPAGPSAVGAATPTVLADFEGGVPAGWFTFAGGSTVTTTTPTVAETDALARPGQVGDNGVLQVDYDVFDFGGFGQDVNLANGGPQDWTGSSSFDFWFYGTGSGLAYQAEISDNRSDPNTDTSERFDYLFTDDTPGWRFISIPFADFTRATDFQPGGAPDDGFTLTEIWAWAIVLPLGADTVYFDDFALSGSGPVTPTVVVDDFESGDVAPGTPCPAGAPPLNFCTFSGDGSVALSNPQTPPAPELPAIGTPNSVLQFDVATTSFAGFIRGFESGGNWVPQNWSTREGFSLWFHGTGSGTLVFIDILENRNPGSTTDDAERWTVEFTDDFVGWEQLQFPFTAFTRKNVNNGAPDDGFDRFEVHGWALGTLNTNGPKTYYVDQVELYGESQLPPLTVGFALGDTPIDEGTTGAVSVRLNRPIDQGDPVTSFTVDFATEFATATAGEEYTPTAGTLTFAAGGPTEQTFSIQTFDDTKFEGEERIVLRLSNAGDVEISRAQAAALIVDDDPYDPDLLDDFEQGAFLWDVTAPAEIDARKVSAGESGARPGQDAVENIGVAVVPRHVVILVEGNVCPRGNGVVPVTLLSTADFDATTVDHTTVSFGSATEQHVMKSGAAQRHVEDKNRDGRDDLVFHFRGRDIAAGCDADLVPFNGFTFDGQPITAGGSDAALVRDFPIGQDWSSAEGLSFWYYGAGGGEDVTVTLKDNRAADPGPSGWNLVWADEFDEPAGTPPNSANWSYELNDGTAYGITGWGNDELQYYTDDPANAATDGNGNLVITAREADGSIQCYYGPCEYTSARLVTEHKAEFAYGRIESRIKVPGELLASGDPEDLRGLWPAFWSLGTDIDRNPWPGAGEIDVMEWVGREPFDIFGTVHGPGYNGGLSFSSGNQTVPPGATDPDPVFTDYHTFSVEWEPGVIRWYVDGIQYHTATPALVPGPWVFEKPFYLLLNMAVGGNFGQPVGENVEFPHDYLIDYVRVYQGPDTAERFEASFTDDFVGWQEVSIPISDFARSADQPDGAPNDGLGLDEVWGYGFAYPDGNATGEVQLDFVRLAVPPPPPNPVFDDFEGGFGWGFFNGNDAGGGGGIATGADAPQGDAYFTTGWGGQGSASGFYGGSFRNVETPDQANPPADPWFNFWVRNGSATTVDQYTLEITIREDLDGNGWTNGSEDSFRLDTTFSTTDFDGQWRLISAPVSSFQNLFTGGDGVFNGDLDEVVIVIAGVQGPAPSDVLVDFDYFAFSSGGPLVP